MLTVENEYLKISVQERGAELCSIFSKKAQREFMWDADPEIWGSYAPVLFPIIGCLKDNEFYHEGKTYSVPKHGFIRNNDALTCLIENPTTILFSYKFTEQTLEFYPFNFEFTVR
ncbi:MAG: aldose 1-epimerase family protein, partial [Crocinitomicaceae bacterium]|nr:aldose 1-epimerase family protein [Crocinitomicaceae bacterium]